MKLCFPIKDALSLESEVYGHFGSTPAFVIIDAETLEEKVVINGDQNHAHGMCSPLKSLSGERVDVVIAGGIGNGALNGLRKSGIKVFKSAGLTVGENIELYKTGKLSEFAPAHVCKGHEGCSHK